MNKGILISYYKPVVFVVLIFWASATFGQEQESYQVKLWICGLFGPHLLGLFCHWSRTAAILGNTVD
jgi:hypothetical protein